MTAIASEQSPATWMVRVDDWSLPGQTLFRTHFQPDVHPPLSIDPQPIDTGLREDPSLFTQLPEDSGRKGILGGRGFVPGI
jgi:hypothetical protein